MVQVTESIMIAAPARAIWEVLADVENVVAAVETPNTYGSRSGLPGGRSVWERRSLLMSALPASKVTPRASFPWIE